MTFEDALNTLETLSLEAMERSFTPLERHILTAAWDQESYSSLAKQLYLTEGHIKDTAAELWQQLSVILNVKVTKRTFRGLIEQQFNIQFKQLISATSVSSQQSQNISQSNTHIDWADAPDTSLFCGRQTELQMLQQLIAVEGYRIIALVGMAGIGKTALAAQISRQIQEKFDFVIWRSLINAPPLTELLKELINFLSKQQDTEITANLDKQLLKLLDYLRQNRCLIILDNIETIFFHEKNSFFRQDYQDYQQFFQCLGTAPHESCLLLTSRKKSPIITRLEGPHKLVRTLEISGLDALHGQQIVEAFGDFVAQNTQWQQLIGLYQGHPLALELVAKHINEVFFGDIGEFINFGKPIFGDIETLLNWHFQQLYDAEIEILYWLGINREAISLTDLREDILDTQIQTELPLILQSIKQHLPLLQTQHKFMLQPVILEYVTEQLIEQIAQAIQTGDLITIDRYALSKTTVRDYIQIIQKRLILQPICDRLIKTFGSMIQVKNHLHQLLHSLRQHPTLNGYGAGNLLNILCQIDSTLGPCNAAKLTIRHGHFQGMNLAEVDFSESIFHQSVFTQCFGDTIAVAFSPDGKLLATAHSSREIQIIQVSTGKLLRTLISSDPATWIWSLRFTPDNQYLISSGCDSGILFWDIQTGQCTQTLQEEAAENRFLNCFITVIVNQRLISSHDDGKIRIWDLETGHCQHRFLAHQGWIWGMDIAADNRTLVTGGQDQLIKLWDIETGECLHTLEDHQDCVRVLSFTDNGNLLVSGSLDGHVKIWETQTGECLRTLGKHNNPIKTFTLGGNQNQLLTTDGSTIRLWDIHTGNCLKTIQSNFPKIRSLAFSIEAQQFVSGHSEQQIKLWDANTYHCLHTLQGYINRIAGVAFDDTGEWLATGNLGKVIQLWSMNSQACVQTFYGHQSYVWSVVFHPDGKHLISSSDDGTVRLWQRQTGQCVKTLAAPNIGSIWSVAVSPDGGLIASGSENGKVYLWDMTNHDSLRLLEGHQTWTWSVAFSPNGQFLASGSDDGTVRVWQVSTGDCLRVYDGAMRSPGVAFSPDGQLLAGVMDHSIKIWEVSSGKPIYQLYGHHQVVRSVVFTRDSQSLISGSFDGVIKLWDMNTGQCIRTDTNYSDAIVSIAVHPDGQTFMANTATAELKLQSLQTAECIKTFKIPRPYDGMNITNITGLSAAQQFTLKQLGAVEYSVLK